MHKRAETVGTCPITNFNQNPFVFPFNCQEQINKVIFVWVYKLENNDDDDDQCSIHIKKPVHLFSLPINWLVSLWRINWSWMGFAKKLDILDISDEFIMLNFFFSLTQHCKTNFENLRNETFKLAKTKKNK